MSNFPGYVLEKQILPDPGVGTGSWARVHMGPGPHGHGPYGSVQIWAWPIWVLGPQEQKAYKIHSNVYMHVCILTALISMNAGFVWIRVVFAIVNIVSMIFRIVAV